MTMAEDILNYALSFIDADICEEFFIGVKIDQCNLAEQDHAEMERVHAHTMHKDRVICVCDSFWDLPDGNQLGIIFHELGHIMDSEMEESQLRCEVKDAEIRADMISELYFGMKIYYDKNKIQWVNEE